MRTNVFIVTGHLGKDPFEKQIPQRTLIKGSLGVNQGRDGDTMWFDLTCWDRFAAEDLMKARKGDCVTVSGKLTMRVWTGRDGKERTELGVDCKSVEVHAGPDLHDIGAVERPIRDRPSAGSGTADPEVGLDDIPF